jgi:hypothetical protein
MRMFAALLVSSRLLAQSVSLGIRAGVPVTPVLTADGPQRTSEPPFTIGPLVEIHLWHGAGLGADFLLRRTDLAISAAGSGQARVWLWEAPITVAYRFPVPMRPFVRTGISFNRVFDVGGATECARGPFGERFYCLDSGFLAELRHQGTSGFVVGGGLRLKFKNLWLVPELRLTHWIDRNFGVRDSTVRSNLNQIELLMGLIF